MDPVTIRPAAPADLDAVHALVERAYRGPESRGGWTHEDDLLEGARIPTGEVPAILADPHQILLVAEQGGEAVGCIRIADKGAGVAHLGLLSVDPRRQAQGLGRRLVAAAEAEAARAFGASRMEMNVIRQRPELIAWYERGGYVRTGEETPFPSGDTRFGRPRVADLAFVALAKAIEGA